MESLQGQIKLLHACAVGKGITSKIMNAFKPRCSPLDSLTHSEKGRVGEDREILSGWDTDETVDIFRRKRMLPSGNIVSALLGLKFTETDRHREKEEKQNRR